MNGNLQITVKTTDEYFFVMAANLADKSTWIYVHQDLDKLCLHKLNRKLEHDEINRCANRYTRKSSGTDNKIAEQLIVCMYTKDDLLSFTISRPSYDRNQRESAISIINHNIVQKAGAPHIIPRYYAIGAGESLVKIQDNFLTEIEALQCQLPYQAEEFGGTYRCVLDCSEECSHHGCKKPSDPGECYNCKNSKVVVRADTTSFGEQIVECVNDCKAEEEALRTSKNKKQY